MKKLLIWAMCALAGACAISEQDHITEHKTPEENRFVQEVFINNLYEPTELVVLPGEHILFTQRRGAIKLYDINAGTLSLYDSLPVYHREEHGLMGVALDPEFDQNNWIYLYYSPVGDKPVQHLSRFTYTPNGLKNEIVMLEVDVQREQCCHTGGSIEFGPGGLLYLSTGDDTNPFASKGYAPIDERPGRKYWDGRRSTANTNDLRGKILRIKPLPDGSYLVPPGNLFEDDDPKTRPEIYVMGCRNPYRIAVDAKRGWLFWGDVGPDASEDGEGRGPRGHDEFNVALKPGFYGWPLFVADNKPYHDYDFETGESGPLFDPDHPVNNSVHNTGLQALPPAQPAKIYYPYARSEEFPQVKNGGRNAMAGPVYYEEMYQGNKKFPSFFNGRVFFYDWMRGFIFSLGLDEEGNPIDWYHFMPDLELNNLIDMTFGPDGQLYLLEYGTGWFSENENARLSRIGYVRGNRPPVLNASLSKTNGAAPLEVVFDASASEDYDGDPLKFTWDVAGHTVSDAMFTYTFEEEGVYYPSLTLADNKGNSVRQQFVVEIGNEPSRVDINLSGNQTFFWQGRKLDYQVQVSDLEDGSLGAGISPDDVAFDIVHYQSFDLAESLGHQLPVSSGQTLTESLDCKACHKVNEKSIGPTYLEVAERYQDDPNAINYLAGKIISGGGGVWGEQVMSAHPDLSTEDAEKIVHYILLLTDISDYPLEGTYVTSKASGKYLMRATYKDQGKGTLKPVETTSLLWLKANKIKASEYDEAEGVQSRTEFVNSIYDGSWMMYGQLDLTDIQAVRVFTAQHTAPVDISVRLGKPDGAVIGSVSLEQGTNAKSSVIALQPTTGVQDVYLTFSSSDKNRLVAISNLEFIPKHVNQ